MYRKRGEILIAVGALMMIGVILWGVRVGAFDFSQRDAGAGLTRMFFATFLAIPFGIMALGVAQAYKRWISNAPFIKGVIRATAISILLVALGFVGVNIAHNIRHYGARHVPGVLMLNLIFVTPFLFLSGILFSMGRLASRD